MKIESAEEKKYLNDLQGIEFVDASHEISKVLVNHALACGNSIQKETIPL